MTIDVVDLTAAPGPGSERTAAELARDRVQLALVELASARAALYEVDPRLARAFDLTILGIVVGGRGDRA